MEEKSDEDEEKGLDGMGGIPHKETLMIESKYMNMLVMVVRIMGELHVFFPGEPKIERNEHLGIDGLPIPDINSQ